MKIFYLILLSTSFLAADLHSEKQQKQKEHNEEIRNKLETARKKDKRWAKSFLKEQSALLIETLAFLTLMGGALVASPILASQIDDIPGKRITTGMTRFSAWYLSSCAFFGVSLAMLCTADAIRK